MSAYLMHSDPSVYESPSEFIPERWLGDIDPDMMRNFVPFSRGWDQPYNFRHRILTVLTALPRFAQLFRSESSAGGA